MKQILFILTALLFTCCSKETDAMDLPEIKTPTNMTQKMNITIEDRTVTMSLVNNKATQALVAKLEQAPVTVTLNSSGGFEIWGALGFSLPTSNEQMNAQPGDVVLYNGSNICIFYGSNSWSYTRLGKIDKLNTSELKSFLKGGENNIKSHTLALNLSILGWRHAGQSFEILGEE